MTDMQEVEGPVGGHDRQLTPPGDGDRPRQLLLGEDLDERGPLPLGEKEGIGVEKVVGVECVTHDPLIHGEAQWVFEGDLEVLEGVFEGGSVSSGRPSGAADTYPVTRPRDEGGEVWACWSYHRIPDQHEVDLVICWT